MEDSFIGSRFGMLVVNERVSDYVAPTGGVHRRYICTCDCGNVKTVVKDQLTSGKTKSCGCLRYGPKEKKHGEIKTRLYRIWGNMCNRCSNPRNPAFDRYGGRGITVCDDWKDYRNFRDWAEASGYTNSLTIDRIDNDAGYNPSNCRWANDYTQANNKRNNRVITYNGEKKTIAEWARVTGIPYKVLYARLNRYGWTTERAFTQPLRKSPARNCAKLN